MRAFFAFVLLAAGATPATLGSPTASLDLLRRAVNPNPTLNSYTASAALSATLHVLIPLHKNVNGTVYYLRPRRLIVFQDLTGPLARFKELAASTPTYDEAMAQYTIAPLTDDGKNSGYVFVPKDRGSRVKSLTLTVSDKRALIKKAVWAYTNGGNLSFDQTYLKLGELRLPAKADIAARFPGYSVDGTLTFSSYKPNAPVSPAVFATPK